jgi:azurin
LVYKRPLIRALNFVNSNGVPMRITSTPLSAAVRRLVVPVIALTLTSSFVPVPLAAQAKPRVVEIIGTDDMKFNVTSIAAKPGEQITIKLTAKGTMPAVAMSHNVVVLALKTDAAAFVTAGMTARATDYIAPADKGKVLAATKLAANGQTVEVTFKAPTVAGSYPYVCTFPGHFAAGMKGNLVVKK